MSGVFNVALRLSQIFTEKIQNAFVDNTGGGGDAESVWNNLKQKWW